MLRLSTGGQPIKKISNLHPLLYYDDSKTEIPFHDAAPWQKAL